MACEDGYTLNLQTHRCDLNTCNCFNGLKTITWSGETCLENNKNQCLANQCLPGFYRNFISLDSDESECVKIECTCLNGESSSQVSLYYTSKKSGAICDSANLVDCLECNAFYSLKPINSANGTSVEVNSRLEVIDQTIRPRNSCSKNQCSCPNGRPNDNCIFDQQERCRDCNVGFKLNNEEICVE